MQLKANCSKEGKKAKGLLLVKKVKTPLENFKTPFFNILILAYFKANKKTKVKINTLGSVICAILS